MKETKLKKRYLRERERERVCVRKNEGTNAAEKRIDASFYFRYQLLPLRRF